MRSHREQQLAGEEQLVKYSIRKQFAAIFICLIMATILLCWFINNTLLDDYYIKNKMKVLKSAYELVDNAFRQGNTATEEFELQLQKVIEKYNIALIVLDAESRTLITSRNDHGTMSRRLWDNFFNVEEAGSRKEVLEEEENYMIQRIMDDRTRTEYIEMWGVLDNGNIFLFRSAFEGIKDSVAIANRFLAYVGMIAVCISAGVILMVSKKITDPLLELAEISERMARLDFDVKYCGKSKTEIAILGHNINELSRTLEQTISELKTANNELKKDIEDKTRIDEMRREFLSSVSHELKTPIALIQGYAEGLKEGVSEDEESRDFYCEVILDEAVKMNHMVQRLMTLIQLEEGDDPVTMERFDIVSLIRNYIQSAEILTRQQGITVIFDEVQPVFVWADEFKTEEVFANYFSNAIHHAAGEKVITVTLTRTKDHVRVSVWNTGLPIPEECFEHLWEKFYKVDKARTREYGGSGVGLSIVKAIMESMHQEFGAVNYDHGVEFWFELEAQ